MRRVLIASLCAMLAACGGNYTSAADNVSNMDVVEMKAAADENIVAVNASDEEIAAPGNEQAQPPPPPPPPPPPDAGAADNSANETVADNATNAAAPAPHIEKGLGTFETPPPMLVGRAYQVDFIVAPTLPAVAEEAGGHQVEAPKQIYISPRMRVTLLPDPANVDITARTDEIQEIGLDKSATWVWDVTPKVDGDRDLTAQVQILGANDEVLDTYTKFVTLHAKVGGWTAFLNAIKSATSLGDLLTTLFGSWRKTLIALAAFLGAFFLVWRTIKSRGKEAPEPPAESPPGEADAPALPPNLPEGDGEG